MAFLCVLHEEAELDIIKYTAPFRSTDSAEDKETFIAHYGQKIRLAYSQVTGKPQASYLRFTFKLLVALTLPPPLAAGTQEQGQVRGAGPGEGEAGEEEGPSNREKGGSRC